MTASANAASAKSGIRRLSNGDAVIPASTRPDGSVRKEIRVKPGYKPPEDVEVYKNRTAEAWKNRGKGGVPGAEAADSDNALPPHKAAANKNAKKREAKKRAAVAAAESVQNGHGATHGDDATQGKAEQPEDVDPEAEKAKEARKLAKKLRQARELKEKQGELLPEQLAKVQKIQELTRQLESLGFDADGEQKAETGKSAESIE